jgi:dephospho-CoA kinase
MSTQAERMMERRQRVHELVLALLAQQKDLELLDGDSITAAAQGNPAGWLERNRRVVQRYQALVRSALTLEAMVDQELGEAPNNTL